MLVSNLTKPILKRLVHSVVLNSTCRSLSSTINSQIYKEINSVALNDYITHLKNEYKTLYGKAHGSSSRIDYLEPIMNIVEARGKLEDHIKNLKELLEDKDNEIRLLAEEEKHNIEVEIEVLDEQLLERLLSADSQDDQDALVLEVNSGVGGQEAMLFASELFEMYCNFARFKQWQIDVAEYTTTDMGGLRHASALISGSCAFTYFKYEAGVHRVQRIPSTEKGGRIHTSTVSVMALPQPSEIEIVIDQKDLRIETKRASGAGGQHVNTTDSAVRITHIPSNTSVECQTDRSQRKNKEFALKRLKAILYQTKLEEQEANKEATKKMQVRSNFRNEKIRTYNFNQDRISDHRLSGENIHNLKRFFLGGESLEILIDRLHKKQQIKSLMYTISQIKSSLRS